MRTKKFLMISVSILLFFTIFNLDLVPLRREISDMEIVMVAGLDKTEDGYEISFLKREEQASTSGSGTGESSDATQVISIKSSNFNSAMNHLQTLTDKYITISHIKYYIVGEQAAKEDFPHIVDTITRGNQTRQNSKVYVSKGMTAKEFLEKASNTDYKVEDKLYNMEDNFITERVSTNPSLINLRHIIMNKSGEGMIATLEYGESEDNDQAAQIKLDSKPAEESKEETPFGFGGAGIIKGMKLIDYLTTDETAIANYIKYNNNVNIIKIENGDDFVTFAVEQLNTNVDFKFDNKDIINELILDVTFKANYEEVKAESQVFSITGLQEYENKLNQRIKKQLQEIIKKEIELNVDFLELKQKLEFKHPIKCKKNNDEFIQKLKECKITINMSGKLQTTYDVVETNIYQEENYR